LSLLLHFGEGKPLKNRTRTLDDIDQKMIAPAAHRITLVPQKSFLNTCKTLFCLIKLQKIYALAIGLLFASLLMPNIAATPQNYSIQFNTYFITGTNQNHTFQIAVDGTTVASGSFLGTGSLSASITLDSSSQHTITAWTNQRHPHDGDNPGDEHSAIYGGSLVVNGQTCASSDDVWASYPVSCSVPTSQPVPEFGNAAVMLVLFLMAGTMVVMKKTNSRFSHN
jgi:hypothetical protein